jgi:hypothetical protein
MIAYVLQTLHLFYGIYRQTVHTNLIRKRPLDISAKCLATIKYTIFSYEIQCSEKQERSVQLPDPREGVTFLLYCFNHLSGFKRGK